MARANQQPEPRETQHREGTKTAQAYELWDQLHKKDQNVSRGDCIQQAIEQFDLTPASANTFYQAWRKERGLTHQDN